MLFPKRNTHPEESEPVPPGFVQVTLTLPEEAMADLADFVAGANTTNNGNGTAGRKADFNLTLGTPEVKFSDVGGHRQVIAQLAPIVQDIKSYKSEQLDFQLPPALVFVGEPGVGKTHMAEAFAGEAGCLFLYLNTRDFLSSSHIRKAADLLHSVFQELREGFDTPAGGNPGQTPVSPDGQKMIVVFLDHFDAVLEEKEFEDGFRTTAKQSVLDAVLHEISLLSSGVSSGVMIIAAVDDGENIPPHIISPERFRTPICLGEPETTEDRVDVLQKGMGLQFPKYRVELGVHEAINEISTLGQMSQSDLREILTIAAESCRRAERNIVTLEDIYDAFQTVACGPPQEVVMKLHRKSLVAYHEHGHAFTAMACNLTPAIISMRPRGDSLGRVFVQSGPLFDPPLTRDDILKLMLWTAGGRAGELCKFGDGGMSIGVEGDLERMRNLAILLVHSGMIDNRMSSIVMNENGASLHNKSLLLVNKVCDQALAAAPNLLKIAGPETLDRAVESSLALERELYSAEAARFYADMISGDALEKMQLEAQRFLANPMGYPDDTGSDST